MSERHDTAADESRVVWRHEADRPRYRAYVDTVDGRFEIAPSAARSEPRCEACARGDRDTHAQHAARSEPRAEGLREAADAALTDFIYEHGSDFDETAWPGFALLRSILPATPPTEGLDAAARIYRNSHQDDCRCEGCRMFDAALAPEQPE